jgi:hypothetical protein
LTEHYTRQANVAWPNALISSGVNLKESAPAFSAACWPFFAPGMGRTLSFSISQRSAT